MVIIPQGVLAVHKLTHTNMHAYIYTLTHLLVCMLTGQSIWSALESVGAEAMHAVGVSVGASALQPKPSSAAAMLVEHELGRQYTL